MSLPFKKDPLLFSPFKFQRISFLRGQDRLFPVIRIFRNVNICIRERGGIGHTMRRIIVAHTVAGESTKRNGGTNFREVATD